jgi:hypothetical protein
MVESVQHVRHPGTADAKVAGERRPALELAWVEQRLVIAGQLERIAAFFTSRFRLRFGVRTAIPGEKHDDSRST